MLSLDSAHGHAIAIVLRPTPIVPKVCQGVIPTGVVSTQEDVFQGVKGSTVT